MRSVMTSVGSVVYKNSLAHFTLFFSKLAITLRLLKGVKILSQDKLRAIFFYSPIYHYYVLPRGE